MQERLQKILAARGVASRREAEQMILDGRVAVNGQIVDSLGSKADPEQDRITVDNRSLAAPAPPRVLMLNKPVGYVSTCRISRETGPSLIELIPADRRYFPVGRLDQNSSGLILLTDDGDLANRLTHPRYGTEKIYLVEVHPPLTADQISRLIDGVMLEDGLARAVRIKPVSRRRVQITLAEGRKRQIRRMIRAVGAHVVSLQRIQLGTLRLGTLAPGQWRELEPREIRQLLNASTPSARQP